MEAAAGGGAGVTTGAGLAGAAFDEDEEDIEEREEPEDEGDKVAVGERPPEELWRPVRADAFNRKSGGNTKK